MKVHVRMVIEHSNVAIQHVSLYATETLPRSVRIKNTAILGSNKMIIKIEILNVNLRYAKYMN